MSQISQRQAAATSPPAPHRAARPAIWLQKTHSHHKVEVFTARTPANGRMKCGRRAADKRPCLCLERSANQIPPAREALVDQKVSSVAGFAARGPNGRRSLRNVTARSLKITKPGETHEKLMVFEMCLQTSANCKQAIKGPRVSK